MKRLESRYLRRRFRPATHVRSPSHQLLFPSGDLGGMDAEWLDQLGERLVAFRGSEGHLRLQGRSMIPPRSFHGLAPLAGLLSAAWGEPGTAYDVVRVFGAPSGCVGAGDLDVGQFGRTWCSCLRREGRCQW